MKAILIDDEPLALDYLKRQLNKIKTIDVVNTFTRFEIDRQTKLLNKVDVIFLDIEMPEINGLEMAEKIIEINPNIIIIFVTAYDDYAVQAFELNALDYILKPVQIDRLEKTVQRITYQYNSVENEYETTDKKLYITVSDDLSFRLNDDLATIHWRTTKAKELFLYLLLNEGKVIYKSDLVELFWEENDRKRAYSLLYTTVYHVRKTLKKFNKFLQLKNKQNGYLLIVENIAVDLAQWEKELNKLTPVGDHNITQYENVMKLYQGPYLHKCDYLWADAERYRLENKWISIAYSLGDYYFQNKNFQRAEAWLIKINQIQPEYEEAHFLLMRLYDSLNYGILVKHQYNKLQSYLQELGFDVSKKVQTWYDNWRQS